MSNTLNTPVEALELEFPLRVVEYSLRRGSGGAGRRRGGDGVIRELEALAPLHYSLITERRRHAPPGAAGGEPGLPGRNLLDGARAAAEGERRAGAGSTAADRDPGRRRVWKTAIICAVSERVAFLGLGIMGSRMAANVARAGFELTVWNRTTATAERFASEHGAHAGADAGRRGRATRRS